MTTSSAIEAPPRAPAADPSQLDITELATTLRTDLALGLSADEAAVRLRADGPNVLREVPPVPLWRRALAQVPSAELVRGDVLVLAEGAAVGADARLAEAAALKLLAAPLTGESDAVSKDVAPLAEQAALGDRRNMVFKGTAVAQGTGRAIVTATGMQTELGGIATLLDTTPDAPTPLQVEIAHLGKVLGLATIRVPPRASPPISASPPPMHRRSPGSSSTRSAMPTSPPPRCRPRCSPASHPSTSCASCARCRPAATWWR
jgi:magnesium-transporting ATPase (P-type)